MKFSFVLFHNGVTDKKSHSERELEDAQKIAHITNKLHRSLTNKSRAVILIEHLLLFISCWVDIHFLQRCFLKNDCY